jgi:hypothetical protein
MQKNVKWLVFYTALLIIIISIINYFQIQSDESVSDINLIYRRIETPIKLWLNGYLGHFFNFKYLGNINWLFIPLSLYVVFKFKYLDTNWKKTLFVVYFLSLLLISLKGYFNARYQLTLLPITTALVFIFIWIILEHNNLLKYKVHIFLVLTFLMVFDNAFSYVFLSSKEISYYKQAGNKSKLRKIAEVIKNNSLPEIVDITYHYGVSKIYYLKYKIISKEKSSNIETYPVLSFLNRFETQEKFLVNNLPMFYYYSNKQGIYYWCGDDTYYTANGRSRLMENRNIEQMHQFVLDSLDCKYVLSSPAYNMYDEKFNTFINQYCKPIYLDYSDFVIYEIQAEKGMYPIAELANELRQKIKLAELPYYVTDLESENE